MAILNKDKRAERKESTADETRVQLVKDEESVMIGDVYADKITKEEVIPYNLDFGSNNVNFSNLGRGNERQLKQTDFLARFERVGAVNESSLSEDQKDFKPLPEGEQR